MDHFYEKVCKDEKPGSDNACVDDVAAIHFKKNRGLQSMGRYLKVIFKIGETGISIRHHMKKL
jgi:hypothetical protein